MTYTRSESHVDPDAAYLDQEEDPAPDYVPRHEHERAVTRIHELETSVSRCESRIEWLTHELAKVRNLAVAIDQGGGAR